MKQSLPYAFWPVTSELSVNIWPAISAGGSAAHQERTAQGWPAWLSVCPASRTSGPTLR